MPGESRTSPRRLRSVARQVRALELRYQGHTYRAIAQALGFAGRQGAQNAIRRALTRMAIPPDSVELRLDLERVDALFVPTFRAAMDGDLLAVSMCLAIMARRAALLGLDAPARTNASISGDQWAAVSTL